MIFINAIGIGNHLSNAFSSHVLNTVVYQADRYTKKWNYVTHPHIHIQPHNSYNIHYI